MYGYARDRHDFGRDDQEKETEIDRTNRALSRASAYDSDDYDSGDERGGYPYSKGENDDPVESPAGSPTRKSHTPRAGSPSSRSRSLPSRAHTSRSRSRSRSGSGSQAGGVRAGTVGRLSGEGGRRRCDEQIERCASATPFSVPLAGARLRTHGTRAAVDSTIERSPPLAERMSRKIWDCACVVVHVPVLMGIGFRDGVRLYEPRLLFAHNGRDFTVAEILRKVLDFYGQPFDAEEAEQILEIADDMVSDGEAVDRREALGELFSFESGDGGRGYPNGWMVEARLKDGELPRSAGVIDMTIHALRSAATPHANAHVVVELFELLA